MFRLHFLGPCALLFLSAAPAAAQPPAPRPDTPLGSRIPVREEPETAGQIESARVLQRFARCLADTKPELVAAVVDPPLLSGDTERVARFRQGHERMRGCLQSAASMSASFRLMTGAFAEQLYRRRFAQLPALRPAEPLIAIDPRDAAFVATIAFANCLIDASAGAADSLVRSSIASREEAAALRLLSANYSACLTAGDTLVLSRLTLRTALADQLYRRANPSTGGRS